jgi:EPS-associated MarR family transcriptional regulator
MLLKLPLRRLPTATRLGGSLSKHVILHSLIIKMSEESVSSYQAAGEEDRQFKVIRLLADYPDMSQRDLATHVGISLGSLNYCLKALMNKGFVKLENFQNSKHKFKYGYILTPSGIAHKVAITGRFLKRKMREYEALKVEIEGLESELGTADGKLRRAPCKWDSDSSRHSLWRLRHTVVDFEPYWLSQAVSVSDG